MSKVVVTGATGYLGSWICKAFSEAGVNVRACTRNLADNVKNGPLLKLANLELVELPDSSDAAALKAAFAGADLVCHVAQPMSVVGSNPTEEATAQYVQFTVASTEAAFNAAKAAGARRVVLTATMASICGNQADSNPAHIWTEKDWNNAPGSAYSKAKTEGERKAWELADALGLELNTIHPALVVGPEIDESRVPTSSGNILLSLFQGKFPGPGKYGIVDVRDVAEAHVKAALGPETHRRFLLNNADQYSSVELAQLAETLKPGLSIPIPPEFADLKGRKPASDPSGAEKLLGHPLRRPIDSMRDTLAALQVAGRL